MRVEPRHSSTNESGPHWIQAAPGKKILAAFSEFDVTANTNCNSDYVVINTGEDSSKYCGKSVPKEIESVGEILEIEFHTNQGDSCRGEFESVTTLVMI